MAALIGEVGTLTPTPTPTSTTARYIDNGDGTVTDHETGLQWEKKDHHDGIRDYAANPHDADNVYNWNMSGFPYPAIPDGTVFTNFSL